MLRNIIKNRLNVLLIILVLLLLSSGVFVYQRIFVKNSAGQLLEEVDLTFDPEGPYALIYPRRDGNALILNIKRTGSYEQIKYELTYNSEGIDRGASGEINTKEKKGEYEQEILFGSCSTGGKCVYDKGVENGTLTLRIKKGKQIFRMVTQWHLQKPDLALGVIISGDSHLTYKMDPKSTDLSLIKFTIVNDLSSAPKLPLERGVIGKVYAVNVPIAKDLPKGVVTIELAENPRPGSKIARFNERENRWVEYETDTSDSKLTATVDGAGVLAVLSPQK